MVVLIVMTSDILGTKKYPRILYVVIFFALATGLYSIYRVHLIGPNPYEQGFMYTAAVASSEGLLPNRDFFMPYGPTTSMIQGFWLNIFGTNLIQLQYVTILSLLLTSALLLLLLKEKLASSTHFCSPGYG